MLALRQEDVLAVLKAHYTFEPIRLTKASGYESHNFLVEARRSDGLEDQEKFCVFVKIKEGWNEAEHMRMEHGILAHLNTKGISASIPVQSREGDSVIKGVLGNWKFLIEVFHYVDGDTLNRVINTDEELCEIAFEVGKALARLHAGLEDFVWDSAYANLEDYPWYGGNGVLVEKYVDVIDDSRTKELIIKYLNFCRTNLLPRLEGLRKGFLQGDYSDMNIILLPICKSGNKKSWKISGVIDFENSGFGCFAADVGIAVAYMMMKAVSLPDSKPLEVARLVIQGYDSMNPLISAEKDTLFEFVVERIAVSYVMGRYLFKKKAEKDETMLSQSKNIPQLFEMVESVGRSAIVKKWFPPGTTGSIHV